MSTRDFLFLLLGTGIGAMGVLLFASSFMRGKSRKGKRKSGSAARARSLTTAPSLDPATVGGTNISSQSPTPIATSQSHRNNRLLVKATWDGFVVNGPKAAVLTVCVLLVLGALAGLLLANKPEGDAQPQPGATFAPTTVIVNIYQRMQSGIEAPRYNVQRSPNTEVVAGLVGRYYYIDLKDARSRRLFFEPEQYIKNEWNADFREAMASFDRDLLQPIRGKVPYRIFVLGSADSTGNAAPYLAELISGDTKQITYLPMVPGNTNQFFQQPTTRTVPKRYANADLPFLRAAYVQEKLQALDYEATILEGTVATSGDERDRNATMILYVGWPPEVASAQVQMKDE